MCAVDCLFFIVLSASVSKNDALYTYLLFYMQVTRAIVSIYKPMSFLELLFAVFIIPMMF